MARGFHAADGGRGLAFTPRVERSNFVASLKPIVAHHHHALRQVEFMSAVSAIAIDLVPISRLEAVKRVPKINVVVSVHVAPRVIAEAVAHQSGRAATRLQPKSRNPACRTSG